MKLLRSAQRSTPTSWKTLTRLVATAIFIVHGVQSANAQGQGSYTSLPPEPVIDWQKKQEDTGRLSALDFGLLGEKIDPHTGGLSFEHTDVVLPGNSSLDVSIRRRITQGGLYHPTVRAEFGDWELIVPRIKVTTSSLSNYRTGNRCSDTNRLQSVWVPYPEYTSTPNIFGGNSQVIIQKTRQVFSSSYSNGYTLDVPGQPSQSLLPGANAGAAIFNNEAFVTASGWKVGCLNNITGGGQGFLATAPDGTSYRFDRFYEIEATRLEFSAHTNDEFDRYVSIVAATNVTDIHGNTVDYTYDSQNRLTKIEASDGRVITLSYTGGTDMISRVSANGRHWDYAYGGNGAVYTSRYEPDIKPVGGYPSLLSVTRPDGLSWGLGLSMMSAETPPALSCIPESFFGAVSHPNGVTGTFTIQPLKHKVTGTTLSPEPNGVAPGYCPDPEPNQPPESEGAGLPPDSQYHAPIWVMSTLSKTLTGPGIETATWNYEYEQNSPPLGPNDDQLNQTDIIQPDGTIQRYFHGWGTEPIIGNQLVKQQTLDSNGVVLREQTNDIIWENSFGWNGLSGGTLDFYSQRARRVEKSVISQDGDSWTTETQFNIDLSSLAYSFGNPTQVKTYSNVSTTPRVMDYTYAHDFGAWILNLPKSTSLNGVQMSDMTYNALGQKTSQSRFGQANYYTFTYHPDGTPASATNAVGSVVEALNWKRGSAQTVRKFLDNNGYGGTDWITTSSVVDDNGWTTSATDARGNTTTYQHDVMGRLTEIAPPSPYHSTFFDYQFHTSGPVAITQTISQGQVPGASSASTVVEYDGLLRTRKVDQSDGAWSSVVTSEFDVMSRPIFTSNPSSTVGARTAYDDLGRPKRNWVGTLSSSMGDMLVQTDYLDNHRVEAMDAELNITTRLLDGYNGPGKGGLLRIDEPLRSTIITRNIYGLPLTLRQEEIGGTNKSVTQHFTYDSQQRLCAHYAPEHGERRYRYDAAGQMIESDSGLGHQPGTCAALWSNARTSYGYDSLGRMIWTDYLDPATPDVDFRYDRNGNMNRTRRGTLNAARTDMVGTVDNRLNRVFDVLNRVTSETQVIDGAPVPFVTEFGYDANGFMNYRRSPSFFRTTWRNDGFGHQQEVRQYQEDANGFPLPMDQMTAFIDNVTYHPDGSLAGYSMGNGQTFTRSLDSLQRTARLRSSDGTLTALDLTYGYTPLSQIASITDGSTPGINAAGKTHTVTGLAYDGLGQLTAANGWWGNGSFSYDGLGNLLSKTLGGRSISVSHDTDKNRMTGSDDSLLPALGGTGQRSVGYDARGNVTSLGSLGLVRDMTNQVVTLTGSAEQRTGPPIQVTGAYQYNGEGKRVKAVVNGRTSYYVYDHTGKLSYSHKATDQDGVSHIRLAGQTVGKWTGSALTYLHTDHLGTPIRGTHGLPNSDPAYDIGDEVFQEFYTPYGLQPTIGWWGKGNTANDPITGKGNNCGVTGFTDHAADCETGLVYMQARHMDPVSSRFLSIDPVGFLTDGRTGMVNRYSYTLNDPVMMVDPDGKFPVHMDGAQGQMAQGVWEGITGPVYAHQLSQGVSRGDPKSIWISSAIGDAAKAIKDRPGDAATIARDSLTQNPARVAGRIVGGAGTSILLGKGWGKIAGGNKLAASTGAFSIGSTNFSLGQIGAASSALGSLYDDIVDAGYDPGDIPVGTLGNSAIVAAMGGEISFDPKTGQVSGSMPAGLGSRIKENIDLGRIKKED